MIAVGRAERPHEGVTGEVAGDFLAECARALAVDNPDPEQAGLEGGMQETVQPRDSLIHGVAVQVQLVKTWGHGGLDIYCSMAGVPGAARLGRLKRTGPPLVNRRMVVLL